MTPSEKAQRLRDLHLPPPMLVLANAWDVATARLVEAAGFPAVATTSAGVAVAHGYADGEMPRREMLEAVERIVAAVQVPVTADLEDGYGDSLDELTALIGDALTCGIVGLNVEDVRRGASALVPLDEQCARLAAIRETSDAMGVPLVINARTDVFLRSIGDEGSRERVAIERANAYRRAGADCLFVPGVTDLACIRRLVAGIDGPVNILAVGTTPPLDDLAEAGVARVSLGSGPMRASLTAFRDLLNDLRRGDGFSRLRDAMSYDEVNRLVR